MKFLAGAKKFSKNALPFEKKLEKLVDTNSSCKVSDACVKLIKIWSFLMAGSCAFLQQPKTMYAAFFVL
jgi:hypothetical protein